MSLVFNDDDEKSVRSGVSDVDIAPKAITSVTITTNSSISNNNSSIERGGGSLLLDIPVEKVDRPSTSQQTKGRSKPGTAPQLFRTPLFSEPPPPESSSERNTNRGSSPSNFPNQGVVPQRPTTGKPPSSSKTTRKQQNVNLENRILIKMASILPTETTKRYDLTAVSPGFKTDNGPPSSSGAGGGMHSGPGRLPESRTNLLKLNGELDEMIRDIRALSLETENCSFGMVADYAHISDETITANIMENGAIVYDAIIAELTGQAMKKVNRVKKFYRNHINKMKIRHEEEMDELKLALHEINGKYHELQVAHSTEILRSKSGDDPDVHETVAAPGVGVIEESQAITELEKILDETSAVPLPKKTQREKIHHYISLRLDEERAVSNLHYLLFAATK